MYFNDQRWYLHLLGFSFMYFHSSIHLLLRIYSWSHCRASAYMHYQHTHCTKTQEGLNIHFVFCELATSVWSLITGRLFWIFYGHKQPHSWNFHILMVLFYYTFYAFMHDTVLIWWYWVEMATLSNFALFLTLGEKEFTIFCLTLGCLRYIFPVNRKTFSAFRIHEI